MSDSTEEQPWLDAGPRLIETPIDPRSTVARVAWNGAGAVLTFAGNVRETHLGRAVESIRYVAYGEMAEVEIRRIEGEIHARWPEIRALIVHRVGHLLLGETSVFLAVASPHRAEAFEALRYGIDTLKDRVPIWKREIYTDGTEAWLEGS